RQPAAHQRAEWVHLGPGLVEPRFTGVLLRVDVGVVLSVVLTHMLIPHRPARRAWPRAESSSRSRAPSDRTAPGMVASVAAEAVFSWTVQMPNLRISGPASMSTYC